MSESYTYRTSVKSSLSDELVNTYAIRPVAGVLVRLLYRTPITPNQVTVMSIVAGLIAAALYLSDAGGSLVAAGLMITAKDVLDSTDGQLARARQQYSRRGRFLDSIGDVVVSVAVFGAIGWNLTRATDNPLYGALAAVACVGIVLRVSYHVFYQVSYLHLEGKYEKNRIIEDITEEDRGGDRLTLALQRIFVAVYGWQDRLMLRIDVWCRGGALDEQFRQRWYSDVAGLRLSGLLGYGTELFILMLFSVAGRLEWYLLVNVVVMNGVMAAGILYRRLVLRRRLSRPA